MRRTPLVTVARPSAAPPAKLVASQLRRMRRIVDAAVELAERGGFDAVRLRDVAERSDVALGTLYKYFRSKEDILLFAFDEGVTRLEQSLAARPAEGGSAQERVTAFFRRATRGLLRKPDLGGALIRAMSGSERETAQQIAASNRRIARMIVASLRDEPSLLLASLEEFAPSADERELADALTGVWFAALIGWVIGAEPDPAAIPRKMRSAAKLMLEGPRLPARAFDAREE
jgi:TetR/AcrR family transcriptional regulator, cholesterol catabolism regulator